MSIETTLTGLSIILFVVVVSLCILFKMRRWRLCMDEEYEQYERDMEGMSIE